METFLVKTGLVVLYLFLFSTLTLTLLGLGGNWFLVGAALVVKFTGLGSMSWWWFGACAGLAVLGEVLEALLGLVVVARKGGTRWGVIGMFIGGIAGAIAGAPVVPPLGSVVFGFVGAFLGGGVGEYLRSRRIDDAVRIGFWSFVGRSLATAAKLAAGIGIICIVIATTW